MNHYDILVIGGGPGGMGAALRAAELGRKTALVERAELGGVCLNWGCIPTKALLKSAQVYHYCRTADAFGVTLGGEAKPDMARIVARSRGVSETMRKGVGFLLEKNKVDVLRGEARLAGEGRVIVADETVSADHIILATGARPREMPFMPIDHEHVLSSRDALVLDELPESMVVVGSGAIGCEFASFYAALGVRVTVVEYLPQLMPLEDEEVARTMERAFRKQRIAVMTSTTVKSVTVDGEGRCRVRIEGKKGEEELTADKVLSAVGIKSNIEGLGLEELGVRVERDKIAVDEHYRTNVEGVYAVGDIVPGPALAHVASAEALHCVEHICRRRIGSGRLLGHPVVRLHFARGGVGRPDRARGAGPGDSLYGGALFVHGLGQGCGRRRTRRLRETAFRRRPQADRGASGRSQRDRDARRACAGLPSGGHGAADRPYDPCPPDDERRGDGKPRRRCRSTDRRGGRKGRVCDLDGCTPIYCRSKRISWLVMRRR